MLPNLRPSNKEPKYHIRWCWVNFFTSYRVHKLILCVDVNVKVGQGDPNTNSSENFPQRANIPNWVMLGQLFLQVITFTTQNTVNLSDLESRSRWPKFELIRNLPVKNPNTELGDDGSSISQGIEFTRYRLTDGQRTNRAHAYHNTIRQGMCV